MNPFREDKEKKTNEHIKDMNRTVQDPENINRSSKESTNQGNCEEGKSKLPGTTDTNIITAMGEIKESVQKKL